LITKVYKEDTKNEPDSKDKKPVPKVEKVVKDKSTKKQPT